MSAVVIVSGRDGSGKTTLSLMLCSLTRYRYRNVGDVLLEDLRRVGMEPSCREAVGAHFLRFAGIARYLELLKEAAEPRTVVDGVRLVVGVRQLRSMPLPIMHVFRESASEVATRSEYESEANMLKDDADIVIPWQQELTELATEAARLAERLP